METVEIRKVRENPNVLTKLVEAGELTLITDHGNPIAVNIPFTRDLVQQGIHVKLAATLLEDGVLALVSAAKIAQLSVEGFLEKLALLGIVAVDYEAGELVDEIVWLNQLK